MAKVKNEAEVMARDAAARIDAARDLGVQLSLLADEDGQPIEELAPDSAGQVGRPAGAKGKVNSQMRDWLAANGYQQPEQMIAQMAGLASREDAILTAKGAAERVLAWAYDGASGGKTDPVKATGAQRVAAFMQIYTLQLRAADALLPYGAPKATPDVHVQQAVTINVPAAPVALGSGDGAVVVNAIQSGRMVPADVALEMQQNQEVTDAAPSDADSEARTK